jgi:chromate transporter
VELVWFFLLFLKASLLSVGGMGNLPMLRGDLVAAGLTTDAAIVEAIAIGRISTGPDGLYVVSLGYFIHGWAGSALALLAIALPPLLVLPLARVLRIRRSYRPVDGLLRGIALSTSGLSIAVGLLLLLSVGGSVPPQGWQVILAAVGLAMGLRGRWHPIVAIGPAGVAGLILAG